MYDNIENFPYVSIFSNTLSDIEDCNDEEEKWNMAFWGCNDEKYLIADDKSAKLLVDWYAENGVDNIGYEDDEEEYDDEMNYIGNGPNGCKAHITVYGNLKSALINLLKFQTNATVTNCLQQRISCIVTQSTTFCLEEWLIHG